MADAFSDAFSFLKALQPSPHHMDEGLPESEMRHIGTMDRMNQRFGSRGPKPEPHFSDEWVEHNPWMGEENAKQLDEWRNGKSSAPMPSQTPPGAHLQSTAPRPSVRTLPPNPARMPPGADAPSGERPKSIEFQDGSDWEIRAPTGPVNWPKPLQEPNMPVSSKNPEGKISDARLQSLADELYIPYSQKAFKKAWSMLKADPDMSIREMAEYSPAYPMSVRGGASQRSTMNPIIARLIRERNEQRAADSGSKLHDFMRQSRDEPHKLEQNSTDDRPSSTYGPQGRTNMPGPSYDDVKEQSQDAHEAAGVVPGDRFSGDYVTRPSGGTATDTGPRRIKTPMATNLEFPYGGRTGDYPVNVKPDSPMAQMYNIAPKLKRLPEGLQPDWMSEFRGD